LEVATVTEPVKENFHIYQELHGIYTKLYQDLKDRFRDIAK